jgi:hypothetical protein
VLVGGALTAGPGWEWIFFINVPVGLAVLAALPTVLEDLPGSGRQRLDLLGAALATASTASLIYALVGAAVAAVAASALTLLIAPQDKPLLTGIPHAH